MQGHSGNGRTSLETVGSVPRCSDPTWEQHPPQVLREGLGTAGPDVWWGLQLRTSGRRSAAPVEEVHWPCAGEPGRVSGGALPLGHGPTYVVGRMSQ